MGFKDCTVPPEYCMYVKKDTTDCKSWLKETHPELYEKIYGSEEEKKEEKELTEEEKKKLE